MCKFMKPDVALLEKYSKPGPRYTSYPTAPYFSESFGPSQWREELEWAWHNGRDLSLYVHIPFCDSLCYYCGCNMVVTRDYAKAGMYLDRLFLEMDRVAAISASGKQARQIHWGGGTPTYLSPEDILRLHRHIRDRFTISGDAEIGCEVDPRELTREHVQALQEAGFNRLSIGVQDLDPAVQAAVNRIQSEDLIREVYGWMREAGIPSINMDLMVGLPHQTVDSFGRTLDRVVEMEPDRLAVFGYAHVPWMKKHQKLIREADLPDFHARMSMQALLMEKLDSAGYVYIGMDHYAKPGDELVEAQRNRTLWRNFQGYTTHRNCDIYAFGASAISQTEDVYVQNAKAIPDYRNLITAGGLATERGIRITRDDKLRREVIIAIMCDLELDKAEFFRRWKVEFDGYFSSAREELEEMEQDGLVQLSDLSIKVTPSGRIFLRNIAMVFDAYLRQTGSDMPRYSRTV